jgi:predicted nuclease of predicted toxin-antitoxin system
VRVLLDECIDWRLSRDLVGHDVKTAGQMTWASLKNGELLTLAADHFDVFVTVDRNLSFQQRLTSFPIAVVILHAKTNRLADLRHLVPELLSALESVQPGTAIHVGI